MDPLTEVQCTRVVVHGVGVEPRCCSSSSTSVRSRGSPELGAWSSVRGAGNLRSLHCGARPDQPLALLGGQLSHHPLRGHLLDARSPLGDGCAKKVDEVVAGGRLEHRRSKWSVKMQALCWQGFYPL